MFPIVRYVFQKKIIGKSYQSSIFFLRTDATKIRLRIGGNYFNSSYHAKKVFSKVE